MPQDGQQKYYAVKNGKHGSRLYVTWEEAKANVWGFPEASQKTFVDIGAAQDWLSGVQQTSAQNPSDDVVAMDISMDGPVAGPSRLIEQVAITSRPASSTSNAASVEPPSNSDDRGPLVSVITLSAEQKAILDLVRAGRSVFFTGSAGTGKSVLLREIIKLRGGTRKNGKLAVTAATGIASVNIGGSTLHSWAGIGLGKEPAEKLVKRLLGRDKYSRLREERNRLRMADKLGLRPQDITMQRDDDSGNQRVIDRWQEVQTLIIDEISMIDGVLFDKLEYIARVIRHSNSPFGGIQLVFSGDFCQLPPVPEHINRSNIKATFAFDARTWSKCIGRPIELKRVFRQKDQRFVDMLNEMRFGRMDKATADTFRALSRTVNYTDGIDPAELYPTRREVLLANNSRLEQLAGPEHHYDAADTPARDEDGNLFSMERVEPQLERLVAPQSIDLKVGAQVMLVKNLIQGQLVNGSLGRVICFRTLRDALRDGTAIEIEGRLVQEVDRPDIPHELLWREEELPIVQFTNGHEILCVQCSFEVVNYRGDVEAWREQLPLILAWALSIHKSQGQTLERVRVDLGRTFENGQAYVALSRATSMEALQVVNFAPSKIRAHPRVLEWYRELSKPYTPPDEIDRDLELWKELL